MNETGDRESGTRGIWPRSLAWGVFCASSWAWCIGLFLPTVLRRLLGWPGFFAFAIPNVLGCAAFGFVLNQRSSRRLRRMHRPAMLLFSAVTIAYQLLLAGWTGAALLAPRLSSNAGEPAIWFGAAIGLACVMAVAAIVARLGDRALPAIAIAAWGFSAAVLGFTATAPPMPPAFEPTLDAAQLWGLLPALLLGFLCCPYLDLTFHRALRQGARKVTFTTFGLTFATLIVLVAFLADPDGPLGMRITPLVLGQLWVQLGFTIGVHAREVRFASIERRPSARRWIVPTAVLAGVLLGLPILANEPNYLRMLGWYGVVFPAYVLLAMVGERGRPRPRTYALLAVVLAVGIPCSEWGISTFRLAWMAAPAPILLAATLWLRSRTAPARR